MARPKTQKAILRAALELLETHGWGKGSYYNEDKDCYCLVGAVNKVVGGSPLIPESLPGSRELVRRRDAALELLGFPAPGPNHDAVDWNDRKRRRFAHIKARIEKALAQ